MFPVLNLAGDFALTAHNKARSSSSTFVLVSSSSIFVLASSQLEPVSPSVSLSVRDALLLTHRHRRPAGRTGSELNDLLAFLFGDIWIVLSVVKPGMTGGAADGFSFDLVELYRSVLFAITAGISGDSP